MVKQDDEIIFEASPDISLSEDPSFIFNYRDSGGPLVVEVEDRGGNQVANCTGASLRIRDSAE